jgi:hypothetical protein
MPRHNQNQDPRFRPWHAGAAAAVIVAACLTGNAIFNDKDPRPTEKYNGGEPLPTASAPAFVPEETPTPIPEISPSDYNPDDEEPIPSASMETSSDFPGDTYADARRAAAARHLSCKVMSASNDGTEAGNQILRVEVQYQTNGQSIAARRKGGPVEWTPPAILGATLDKSGRPDGGAYGDNGNGQDKDPDITHVGLPLDADRDKGERIALSVQTLATSKLEDGQTVTTIETLPCSGLSVWQFNGNRWDHVPQPEISYEPYIQENLG